MTRTSSPHPPPEPPPEPPPRAAKPRIVTCPQCGGDSVYAATNPSRPFCSERCKNVDFGAWASESFRVEVAPTAQDDADASAAGPTTH